MDEKNKPVGFPFHYRDRRTEGLLDEITSKVSREEIYGQTGIQFMEINTLVQLYAASKTGDSLQRAKRLLMMPDFFHWCLTGEATGEFTIATTSQCYDPTRGNWATPLLEQLGIPSGIMPRLVQPGDLVGPVQASVAQATGLESVNVIAPGGHDTASAVAAIPVSPADRDHWAYISSGTWSLVGLELEKPVLNEAALAANITNEGGIDGTWRLLKNVVGLWLVQQLKASSANSDSDLDYAGLTTAAAEATPFVTLIDVNHPDLMRPGDIVETVKSICQSSGQPVPDSLGAFARCMLESLACEYHHVLKTLGQIADRQINVIHVVGGGSQNNLLNQLIADACAVPVVAGPVEATVLGNVLVQCRTSGGVGSLDEMRSVVRNSVELKTFEPQNAEAWREQVARYESLRQQS